MLWNCLEAVRIADKRQPNDLRWGSSDKTVGQLYEDPRVLGTRLNFQEWFDLVLSGETRRLIRGNWS